MASPSVACNAGATCSKPILFTGSKKQHLMPECGFVAEYLKLRGSEGRVYPDEWVRCLPHMPRGGAHASEWRLRARSARRLRHYLGQRTPLRLLEVGCGNGWLSHYLSLLPGTEVLGIDINGPELEQARRLFVRPNLSYRQTTLEDLSAGSFDCILFAASFQYFSDVPVLLEACFRRLVRGGSVHIIDTHFYPTQERAAARDRSAAYFARQNAATMELYYQ
ncbi:MAG: class I SAM-dependent methyltransferase, partial [Chitinophagaceae bacterium]